MKNCELIAVTFCTALLASVSTGCMQSPQPRTAAQHQQELSSTQERKTTLGLFQASIKEGMDQADVAAAVGSPNIVTQDSNGNDTWIYDKISTEESYSGSTQAEAQSISGGVGGLGYVLGGTVGALLGGGVSSARAQGQASRAGASSQSQKTLTVVVKFNSKRKVSDIRYQTSSF